MVELEFKPDQKNGRWFIQTNTGNLRSILAKGFLCPSVFIEDYSSDHLPSLSQENLIVQGGFINFISGQHEPDEIIERPVLLELAPTLKTLPVTQILNEATNDLSLSKAKDELFVTYKGALELSHIACAWLSSEEDVENFLARPFDNVPFGLMEIKPSPALFSNPLSVDFDSYSAISTMDKDAQYDDESVKAYAEDLDRYMSTLSLLSICLPSDLDWYKHFATTFLTDKFPKGLETKSDLISHFLNLVTPESPDKAIHLFAYQAVMKKFSNDGFKRNWSDKELVQSVSSLCANGDFSEAQVEKIKDWSSYTTDVLSGKRDFEDMLGDDRSWVLRALFLFTLKKSPEKLIKSKHSNLSPGERVMALGMILSGYNLGYERLPTAYKENNIVNTTIRTLAVNDVNKFLGVKLGKKIQRSISGSIEVKETSMLATRIAIQVGNEVFSENHLKVDPSLQTAKTLADSLNMNLKFDSEKMRFEFVFNFPHKRKQKVFIEKAKLGSLGKDVLRFWSPCLNLSDKEHKKLLTAKELKTLLELNVNQGMHCRFGVDVDENAVVVLTDQIASTMQDIEFESHIKSVAEAADRYEADKGLDVY